MNLVECVELATNVQEELEDMRENALLVFSEMCQEIQVVASQIDLELKKPRLVRVRVSEIEAMCKAKQLKIIIECLFSFLS